jgi:2,4-dienoyl-CoA reductase-like NADH-dependent reductase (Old Yellow Enzyme family)
MHAGRKARQKPPDAGRGPLERSPDIADWDDWDVIAPSAVTLPGESAAAPREMTAADIQAVIDAFVAGARRADAAGYEVLDLHAAHGYLLHSFLSPLANHRGDAWGGSFANRVRILLEIVAGVRTVWPQGKPIFVRLSCIDGGSGGWTLEDTIALVRQLHPLGVDLIDCSAGGITGSPPPARAPRTATRSGSPPRCVAKPACPRRRSASSCIPRMPSASCRRAPATWSRWRANSSTTPTGR